MPKRIDALTPEQEAAMPAHAQKWIEIGLQTGEADWELFEDAARRCYEFAGIPWHNNVIRVPNPVELAVQAPHAAHVIAGGDPDDAESGEQWWRYLGGQLWVGGWWGPAPLSFFREVCGLELPGDLWARAQAWEDTCRAACWWWAHRDFVMVCDRPNLVNTERVEGDWVSYRLHCDDGPAVAWDGWAVWAVHGVRVPQEVVESPGTLKPDRVLRERNIEVRRVMIDRMGAEKIGQAGERVQVDDWGELWRVELAEDEPLVMVKVVNSTPEPDGSVRDYWLRVAPGTSTAHEGVAASFGLTVDEYDPQIET